MSTDPPITCTGTPECLCAGCRLTAQAIAVAASRVFERPRALIVKSRRLQTANGIIWEPWPAYEPDAVLIHGEHWHIVGWMAPASYVDSVPVETILYGDGARPVTLEDAGLLTRCTPGARSSDDNAK